MAYEADWIDLSEAMAVAKAASITEEELRRALYDGAVKARGLIFGIVTTLNSEWWTSDVRIVYARNEVEVGEMRLSSVVAAADFSPFDQNVGKQNTFERTPPRRPFGRATAVVVRRADLERLTRASAGLALGERRPNGMSLWKSVDPLTVEQAAALWAEVDPSTSIFAMSSAEQARVTARKQMLVSAIMESRLAARTDHNALRIIGDHDKSLVSIDNLRSFALQIGERPAFLFCQSVAASGTVEASSRLQQTGVKTSTGRKVGRPPGAGEINDSARLLRMKEFIESRQLTPTQAATEVMAMEGGKQKDISRLVRKYCRKQK